MDNKEYITSLAKSLGEALVNTEEYKNLLQAKKLFAADKILEEQINELKVQKALLEIEEEKETPDENLTDILTSRCNTLYDSITSNPVMTTLTEAEKAFSVYTTAVNMTIDSYINTVELEKQTAEGGCSPSKCASCKGCH